MELQTHHNFAPRLQKSHLEVEEAGTAHSTSISSRGRAVATGIQIMREEEKLIVAILLIIKESG